MGLPKEATDDLKHASGNYVGGHQNLDFDQANKMLKSERKSISLSGYATRLHRAYQFINLLRNTEVRYPFERSLDIGCGYAIQPRILKALGIVREAVGIDIYDRASAIDERVLSRQHRRFRRLRRLDSIQGRIDEKASQFRTGLDNLLFGSLRNPRISYKQGSGWMPDAGVFNLRFVNKPSLDRFINGDVYDLEEKFDLVTMQYCLPWFDAKLIFKKISELLKPGGVFYAAAPNWWCSVNPTLLAGHFPFAPQRLTQEDYFRYLDEFHSQNAEAMKVWYRFFDPRHPTLSDYIGIAHENGLVTLDYKSNVVPLSVALKRAVNSVGYFQHDYVHLDDVLEDIHQFRPDVRLEDLLADTHCVIFKKVDKNNRIDMLKADQLLRDGQPRPQSQLSHRIVRKLSSTVFGRWGAGG